MRKYLDKLVAFARRYPFVVSIVALVIALVWGVSVIVTTDNGHIKTVTISLPTKAPVGDVQEPTPLKDETPPGVSPAKHEAIVKQAPKLDQTLTKPQPVGGAQNYSCTPFYGGHLWSSRNGIKPTEFVVHYTAGNGTPEAIDAYFRHTREASATYIMGLDGHCIQEVPESEKPWTQLTANPYAISVELVTTGYNLSRAQWLAAPIFKQGILASLMRDSMKRHGIPLRHVDPVGCNFIAGWTDHNALECGNDHVDVTPSFPYATLQAQLTAPSRIAATDKIACRKLNWYRKQRRHRAMSFQEIRKAVHRRRLLARHHVTCKPPRR